VGGIEEHLMTGPTGNSEFCFSLTLNVPLNFASGNIEGLKGNKAECFPWGQPLSAYCSCTSTTFVFKSLSEELSLSR